MEQRSFSSSFPAGFVFFDLMEQPVMEQRSFSSSFPGGITFSDLMEQPGWSKSSFSSSFPSGITFSDLMEQLGWSVWVTSLEHLKRESSWCRVFKLILTIMGKKKGEKKCPNFTCPTPAFFNFPVEKARTTQLLRVVSSEGSGFGKQLLKTKKVRKQKKSPFLLPEQ